MVASEVFTKMRISRWCLRFALLALVYSPIHSNLAAQSEADVNASIKKFTQIYEAVETNFADKVDPDRSVYKGAIPGMLRTLDPHSNFFDPKAYQLLREGQAGHYYGVGMWVGAPLGKVIVMWPFEGSPAYRAGLRPGDEIIGVNDTNTERSTVSQVSAMLKGPRGTPVTVTARRVGSPDPLHFALSRDNVPRDSVTTFWLRPGIAYMKIDAFNETTSHEVDQALTRFPESQIEGLVLDLRGNGGGLVQESVNVADRFLRKGQLVVSHHGRASAETKFVAKHGERGREFPMVILVDRGTASASEILSGALQDHDRAWIVGEQTFGKGLVQAPFPLYGNSALLLTIAKYYTPSGRLIQRDYAHQGFYEYLSRNEGHYDPKDMKKTDSGRVVFGGDGITPDEKYETPKLTKLEGELVGGNVSTFFLYAPQFFATHPNTKLTKEWVPDAETVDSFKEFAAKQGIAFTPEEFDRNRTWITDRLREELYITAFSKDVSDQVALRNDPEVLKGIDALSSSKALLDRAHDTVASKKSAITSEAR
jgi:carboxyl-terminal processing protease